MIRFIRDLTYWAIQALLMFVGAVLFILMRCTDPSDVDDSLIVPCQASALLLALLLVPLVVLGARPAEPLASALIPAIVLLCYPWADLHDAAYPTLAWIGLHLGVVIASVLWPRK